jgi:sortase (surface protein transpeptidase)
VSRLLIATLLAIALLIAGCGEQRAAQPAAPPLAATPVPVTGTTRITEPTAIAVPAIGVQAEIVQVGLNADNSMQTPDFGLAGWYAEGPRPGERGPAVIVAHVDSRSGPDVFYRLRDLTPGDEIAVEQADGRSATFVVESMEQTDKDDLPVHRIWNDTDQPVLRLITCGGIFDRSIGHYEDNIIVYASAA